MIKKKTNQNLLHVIGPQKFADEKMQNFARSSPEICAG